MQHGKQIHDGNRPPGALRRQAIAFAWVGAAGFVVDTTMTLLFAQVAGLAPEIARLPATSIAIAVTFVLNRNWTFRSADAGLLSQFARYLGVSLTGAMLNYIGYAGILLAGSSVGLLDRNSTASIVTAIAAAAVVAAIFNFAGSRHFAFADRPAIRPRE